MPKKEKPDAAVRQKIADILVDTYSEDEEAGSWGVAFQDEVKTPFAATLLDIPVEVLEFRTAASRAVQCRVEKGRRKRWVGVEDLDEKGLPEDMVEMLEVYRAWLTGDY